MRRRFGIAGLAIALLVVVAILGGAGLATAQADHVESCVDAPPANGSEPANDTIGYVEGYWYDDAIEYDDSMDFDDPDLREDELNATVARTAARVEALRCLDFDELPNVTVVDRDELEDRQDDPFADRPANATAFDDARLEAALLLGTEDDPNEARAEALAGATRAFYEYEQETVTLVTDDDAVAVDESLLAHELLHALQDQQFNVSSFDAAQTDAKLVQEAVVEGDAAYLERRYEQRCLDEEWSQDCLSSDSPDSDADPAVAIQLLYFQPYNDGAAFVEHVHEEAGWESVDAQYERLPRSVNTVQYPDAPPSPVPVPVELEDPLGDDWERLAPFNGTDHDVLGPGTIGTSLIAPTFEEDTEDVYDADEVQHHDETEGIDAIQQFDYGVEPVEHWFGDRLDVYRNEEGSTGSVWRTEWRTDGAAETFENRYEDLLDARGAEPMDEFVDAYRFEASSSFDGVVGIVHRDDAVTVVHGPSLGAVRSLHPDAAENLPDDVRRPGGGGDGDDPSPAEGRAGGDLFGAVLALSLVGIVVTGGAVALRRHRR